MASRARFLQRNPKMAAEPLEEARYLAVPPST